MPATEPFAVDDHDATTAVAGVGRQDAGMPLLPVHRYEGPHGPVHESHTDTPPITRVWGEHVPIGTFDVGSASRDDLRPIVGGPEPIVSGAIGHQPVTVRRSAASDRRSGALTIALGTARYELASTGMWPRAALYRDDLTELASYTVLGRRPHRIASDASPEEVVLTVFLLRFAARLAYRR